MDINFADIKFKGLTRSDILSESDKLKIIITANAEFIVKAQDDKKFNDILSLNYTTFDGQIPFYIASRQNPDVQIEKISGSDLIYDFCKLAEKQNKRMYLLGGYEKSNKLSVDKLRELYCIEIDGYSPPYKPYPFDRIHNEMILKKIEKYKPRILFVGFGAIKQEYWIDDNKKYLESIGIRWVIGSGGTFEFVSGEIKRAPIIVQKAGLEGVWRFFNEPKWFRFKRLVESIKIIKYI